MKVYVILIEGRHSSPNVQVCSTKDFAITEAQRIAKKACTTPEDYYEYPITPSLQNLGFVFSARYSCESEWVSVLETSVLTPTP